MVKRLEKNDRNCKLVSMPIDLGISLESSLKLRARVFRLVRYPIDFGMEPFNELVNKANVVNLVKPPMDSGIELVRWFSDRSRPVRDVNRPISLGKDPCRRYLGSINLSIVQLGNDVEVVGVTAADVTSWQSTPCQELVHGSDVFAGNFQELFPNTTEVSLCLNLQ